MKPEKACPVRQTWPGVSAELCRKSIAFELDGLDLGQLLDGLEVRAEAWEKTADYHRTGESPPDFIVEECNDADEADQHREPLPFNHRQDSETTRGAIMSEQTSSDLRDGFCIYINTFCQGPVPVVSDDNGYVVFATELEAQKEIVDNQMTRLQQFLDGEREYEDAIEVEEYVVPVTVHPDGKIVDEDGRCFGPEVF